MKKIEHAHAGGRPVEVVLAEVVDAVNELAEKSHFHSDNRRAMEIMSRVERIEKKVFDLPEGVGFAEQTQEPERKEPCKKHRWFFHWDEGYASCMNCGALEEKPAKKECEQACTCVGKTPNPYCPTHAHYDVQPLKKDEKVLPENTSEKYSTRDELAETLMNNFNYQYHKDHGLIHWNDIANLARKRAIQILRECPTTRSGKFVDVLTFKEWLLERLKEGK